MDEVNGTKKGGMAKEMLFGKIGTSSGSKFFVGEVVKGTEGTPLLREAEALVAAGRAMPERRRSDSEGRETAWIRQGGAMAASL